MIIGEYVRFAHADRVLWAEKRGDDLGVIDAAPWLEHKETGERLHYSDVELLAPAEPTKIVCVGLNYRDHAEEMKMELPDEPKIFFKPPSALLGAGKSIRLPPSSGRVDYEAELAVVIGSKTGPGDGNTEAIFGFTCANDVTARDLQKIDGQWARAKGFDTFCPLGPTLKTGVDVTSASIRCRVNAETKQDSSTKNLIFSPEQIVSFVAGVMTLMPGDVVLTGTPGGIGPLKAGDEVEVSIEGLEPLQNLVVE